MTLKLKYVVILFLFPAFLAFSEQFPSFQVDSISVENSDTSFIKNNKIKTDIDEPGNENPKTKVLNSLPPGIKKADSLFLFSDNIMLVDVKKISYKEVFYTEPGEMTLFKIDRRKVHKIIYKSGLVEILNSVEKNIPDSKDWKVILVTENPEDVADYIMLEKIKGDSQYVKEDASNETLERSALVILKKKASLLDADAILITDREFFRGYGEPPKLTIKGIAYKMN